MPERRTCTVVLLAAGRGLRMGDLTREIPKALIPVDGERAILDINVEHVRLSIADPQVVVVGGHGWDRLQPYCAEGATLPLHAVFNSEFATAGPARSMLAGLMSPHCDSDLLIVANGDTLFSAAMLSAAAKVDHGCRLSVSHTPLVVADDLLVSLDDNGKVLSAVKSGSHQGPGLISSGLLAVRGAGARAALMNALEDICAMERDAGKFLPWHAAMARLAANGVPAAAHEMDRGHWAEFDTTSCIESYERRRPVQDVTHEAAVRLI